MKILKMKISKKQKQNKNHWIKEIQERVNLQVNRNSISWGSGKIFYLKIDKASGICGTIFKNACKWRPKRRGDRKVGKNIFEGNMAKNPPNLMKAINIPI